MFTMAILLLGSVWCHPPGPKSAVLVYVELLSWQAETQAERLASLKPEDRQAVFCGFGWI